MLSINRSVLQQNNLVGTIPSSIGYLTDVYGLYDLLKPTCNTPYSGALRFALAATCPATGSWVLFLLRSVTSSTSSICTYPAAVEEIDIDIFGQQDRLTLFGLHRTRELANNHFVGTIPGSAITNLPLLNNLYVDARLVEHARFGSEHVCIHK